MESVQSLTLQMLYHFDVSLLLLHIKGLFWCWRAHWLCDFFLYRILENIKQIDFIQLQQ